jgi:hypothetical protein
MLERAMVWIGAWCASMYVEEIIDVRWNNEVMESRILDLVVSDQIRGKSEACNLRRRIEIRSTHSYCMKIKLTV